MDGIGEFELTRFECIRVDELASYILYYIILYYISKIKLYNILSIIIAYEWLAVQILPCDELL